MVERPARPFPVISQLLFGLSFVAFLMFGTKAQTLSPYAIWIWCGLQIALGFVLMRGRIAAKKTNFALHPL